jgi:hypothetical protein
MDKPDFSSILQQSPKVAAQNITVQFEEFEGQMVLVFTIKRQPENWHDKWLPRMKEMSRAGLTGGGLCYVTRVVTGEKNWIVFPNKFQKWNMNKPGVVMPIGPDQWHLVETEDEAAAGKMTVEEARRDALKSVPPRKPAPPNRILDGQQPPSAPPRKPCPSTPDPYYAALAAQKKPRLRLVTSEADEEARALNRLLEVVERAGR